MAKLPPNHIITSAGTYDLPNLIPGREYLLTLRGAGSATLSFNDGPGDAFVAVKDGEMLGTKPAEARLIPPSSTLRISVSSVTSNIRVNLLPIQ